MVHTFTFILTAALWLLGALPHGFAHGHGEHEGTAEVEAFMANTTLQMSSIDPSIASLQSYFTYPEHATLLSAHIAFMVIAWFFILPIEVVLSLARSRRLLPAQLSFLVVNGLGLLLGKIYTTKTPDLYEHNIHSPLGWALTVVISLQCIIVAIQTVVPVGVTDKISSEEHEAFIPVSAQAMKQHQAIQDYGWEQARFSRDSGQGTEPEYSPALSVASSIAEPRKLEEDEMSTNDSDRRHGYSSYRASRALLIVSWMVSSRPRRIINFFCNMINVLILPMGFVAMISGMVIYGGVFRGSNVLNGLAHTIKGGIFFWYGLLTLGRWMGCMVEYGWAWNVRPPMGVVSPRKFAVPSAEFVESFVIFLYGSTNVFLEHLAAWGGAWTAQDLEHVSISIMFFGGGLCGMLIESQRIRDLLNATIRTAAAAASPSSSTQSSHPHPNPWSPPATYPFSLNPFPALIILLLGILMSSHHQASPLSTMIHHQWGSLFVGFALARALTYMVTFIAPPRSYLPSRPPTELVAAFCLIAGGIVFMLSNKDSVGAMEANGLDAMFTLTVTMGATALVMAWGMVVVAVKGWVVEGRAVGKRRGAGGIVGQEGGEGV